MLRARCCGVGNLPRRRERASPARDRRPLIVFDLFFLLCSSRHSPERPSRRLFQTHQVVVRIIAPSGGGHFSCQLFLPSNEIVPPESHRDSVWGGDGRPLNEPERPDNLKRKERSMSGLPPTGEGGRPMPPCARRGITFADKYYSHFPKPESAALVQDRLREKRC